MKTRIKPIIFLALLLLSVFSFAQERQSTKPLTYVENEFIIWLEQGVDAYAFAENTNTGILPKRLLSERLNIWLFDITNSREQREDLMDRLAKNTDVRVVQNNHTNIVMRELIPDDPYYTQQWAPAIMSLPGALSRRADSASASEFSSG